MKVIKQGAEARLCSTQLFGRKTIAKERFTKKYRHPDLDERLTKERMRAELRGLSRCKAVGIKTPAVYFVDSKKNIIYMEELEGVETVNVFIGQQLKQLGDFTTSPADPPQSLKALAVEIGSIIGQMHSSGIIHGDLTTSNILVSSTPDSNKPPTIYLIDFGLSSVASISEDKGVDLYVLERALTSTFSSIPWFFEALLEGYVKSTPKKDGTEVLRKLDEIRLRGRKRLMIG